MNWQYVDIAEVIEIHLNVIVMAGTKAGIRDFSLLHSAVERPKASFDGKDLYPTVYTKAAALLQSTSMNHPFTDGNKRAAWLTTKWFLYLNNYQLKAANDDAVSFIVAVDKEQLELPAIATWLKKHSKKLMMQMKLDGNENVPYTV